MDEREWQPLGCQREKRRWWNDDPLISVELGLKERAVEWDWRELALLW